MAATERRLMFGLTTSQAAATLAAALIGYEIILPDGSRLLNEDILNGTILLILFTCSDPDSRPEKILIPLANPDTVKDLVCLSMAVRDPMLNDNLYALSILYDTDNSKAVSTASRNLDNAARIAASAHVDLKKLSRYDLNIASGIIHTVKEQEITSLLIGLRRDADSPILGNLAVNLLKSLSCEVLLSRLMVPINTLSQIVVAVPPKAEYEAGFSRWVEH